MNIPNVLDDLEINQTFKFKMLRERVISAVILAIAITSLVLFLSDTLFIFFAVVISTASLWEFLKARVSLVLTSITAIIFCALIFLSQFSFFNLLFIFLGVVVIAVSTLFILSFPLNKTLLKNQFIWMTLGIIIHLAFFSSIFHITENGNQTLGFNLTNDRFIVLLVALVSILMDTIAYFAGKKFGKRPFINNVSPNKTMEGFLSAIVATPFILTLISVNFLNTGLLVTIIIFFVVSLFSVIGDAVASMMKRVIEIKDFSDLIPGHGGIYDRLDSHIASFPSFVLLLNFFG